MPTLRAYRVTLTSVTVAAGATETLQHALRRVSGTTLDVEGAANVWAGTSGKSLVAALNVKAGTSGLDIDGVCNVLAGTPGAGHGIDYCAALFV